MDSNTRTDHTHTVASTSEPRGYSGPVVYERGVAYARRHGLDEHRAAHGNIQVTDRCACGYERRRLINGRHEELGPWVEGEELIERRRAREQRREAMALREHLRRGVWLGGCSVRLQIPEVGESRMDTRAIVLVRGRHSEVTVLDLYQAAADWSDSPESTPAVVYGAIAETLSRAQL